jgi:hypothetical protein
MMPRVPDWVRDAVEEYGHQEVQPVSEPIRPGDLRLVPVDGGQRIVLVLDVSHEDALASVALTTPDIELCTDQDAVFAASDVQLPFALAVESDVVGPVDPRGLGPRVGSLVGWLVDLRQACWYGSFPEALQARRGFGVAGPIDPRWRMKGREAELLATVVAAPVPELRYVVDPRIFERPVALTELRGVLVMAARLHAELPAAGLERLLRAGHGGVDLDVIRALGLGAAPQIRRPIAGWRRPRGLTRMLTSLHVDLGDLPDECDSTPCELIDWRTAHAA